MKQDIDFLEGMNNQKNFDVQWLFVKIITLGNITKLLNLKIPPFFKENILLKEKDMRITFLKNIMKNLKIQKYIIVARGEINTNKNK